MWSFVSLYSFEPLSKNQHSMVVINFFIDFRLNAFNIGFFTVSYHNRVKIGLFVILQLCPLALSPSSGNGEVISLTYIVEKIKKQSPLSLAHLTCIATINF